MKARATNMMLTLVLSGACLVVPRVARARAIPVDGYAALVNDRVITVGDVLAAMEPVRQQLLIMYEREELDRRVDEAYQTTLQSLIDRALIVEDFKAQGGNVPDRVVDDYLNQIISERYTNRVELLKMLQAQRLTWEDWRNEMRDRLVVAQMRQRDITSRVVVTPQQVREAYERNQARYQTHEEVRVSLIGLQKGTNDEEREIKRAEAQRLRDRVLSGEEFAGVARAESEGPNAAEGGDQGWRKPDEFSKQLYEVIRAMEPGQISPVIETDTMFFILKLEARKHAMTTPFEDVRAQIEAEVRKQEEERLYRIWIEQLRKKHHVQMFKERLSSL